MILQEIK